MLSGSAAVLAQCLTCEQNDHLKNISYTICEREGGIQVSNTQLGTEQPFLSCFYCSSEMPIICAHYNLFPGKAVPKYSCVLSGLILFKVVYVILLFLVAVSLGFLCLRNGSCNRSRWPLWFRSRVPILRTAGKPWFVVYCLWGCHTPQRSVSFDSEGHSGYSAFW